MNYYEELGLCSGASAEEIHQAYRNVIRILHPDQYPDQRLKALAECQLKRLNEVIAVLGNPDRRREYDLGLQEFGARLDPPANPLSRVRPILLRHPYAWTFAAMLAGFLVWYPGLRPGGGAENSQAGRFLEAEFVGGAPKQPESSAHGPRPRTLPGTSSKAPLPPKKPTRTAPVARERTSSHDRNEQPPPLVSVLPPLVDGAAGRIPQVSDGVVIPLPAVPDPLDAASSTMSGEWVYVPGRGGNPAGNYPPQLIQLRIAGKPGRVRGRYWARYRIEDQPISGEVLFEFEGAESEGAAQVVWAGNGGARGAARLILIEANAILVRWWTTQNGRRPGLTSGSAILVRR